MIHDPLKPETEHPYMGVLRQVVDRWVDTGDSCKGEALSNDEAVALCWALTLLEGKNVNYEVTLKGGKKK